MNKSEIYVALQQKVEMVAGRNMNTPRDFDYLSTLIFDRTKAYLAPITLKRFWGYLGEEYRKKPYRNTLDILAIYAGYTSFEAFENSLRGMEIASSDYLPTEDLQTASLRKGARIELKWAPDRCVKIEYEGFDMFRVIEAANSKLAVGDTFQCYHFVNNEPLHLRCLVQNNGKPTGFVCGRTGGVQYRVLTEDL